MLTLCHNWYRMMRYLVFPIQGHCYLIIGASKGIGKALALKLAQQGKSVVLVARNTQLLNELKLEIETTYGTSVFVYTFDVTNTDKVNNLFTDVNRLAGPIDSIVINAALYDQYSAASTTAFQQDLKILNTNLIGPIALITAFVHYANTFTIANPHIIVVTSLSSIITEPQKAAYCCSKIGLSHYLECCSMELERQGFYFTNIRPGLTDTEMAASADKSLDFLKVSPKFCASECWTAIKYRQRLRYSPNWLYYPLAHWIWPFLPFKTALMSRLIPLK